MNYTQKPRQYNLRTPAGLLFVTFLVGGFLNSGCASFRSCDDAWFGADKQKHFIASAALGAGFALLADGENSDGDATLIGITSATAFGAGKEWYDLSVKKSCWSWRDLVWDIMGASFGASVAVNSN